MQIIDDLNRVLKEKKLSVLKVSKETGIPASRIYKWLDGKGRPKHEDVQKVQGWIKGDLEEIQNTANEPEIDYKKLYLQQITKTEDALRENLSTLTEQVDLLKEKLHANLDSVLQAQYAQLAHQKALAWYLAQLQAGKSEAALKAELQKINNKVAEYVGLVPEKGKKVNS